MIMSVLKSARVCFSGASFLVALSIMSPRPVAAQAAPGPYEWLPFQDAYILEAYFDLLQSSGQIADWSGWTGSSWTSPHAYNNHTGTDFALQTGTPVYATAAGTVAVVANNVPEGNHSSGGYGNYVRIAVSGGTSPEGQTLDFVTAHMLPNVMVTVGQTVASGQQLGFSDNTGDSTSEHSHCEATIRPTGVNACPFYSALFKYPVMFNPTGSCQVGHVVRVTAASSVLRADRYDTSAQVTTAHAGQTYFAAYWQHGYYRVFIPNDATNRGAWLRATDAEEIFSGATVIQALPDAGTYVHAATLAAPLALRASASSGAAVVGNIVYGGGRFVADQVSGGWYRIPVPGATNTWGWVQPTARMVVYPQIVNPALNLAVRPNNAFPIAENFAAAGESPFGRPKFNRSVVKSFAPAAPTPGDGLALFVTDSTNSGDGVMESVMVGQVDHRNYFAQVDCYFNFKGNTGIGYERYGLFVRDDGFAGLDQTFEGRGNCYAITFDSDDGHLRAARISEATITDLLPTPRYEPSSGWHTLRIEANGDQITFRIDGTLMTTVTDTSHRSGPCGVAYSSHFTGYPADRGANFDNFRADTLPTATVDGWEMY